MIKRFFSLSWLLAAFILTGCASNKLKSSENPEVVFNEGNRLLEDGRYIEASEFFNEIRHRFPQSRFAAMAELRTADLEFKQDNFTEAAAAYGVFLDLYPNHAEAAYAQYQRALSYFNEAPEKVSRDQSSAQSAAAAAEQLMKRYPDSPYAEKAKEIYQKSRIRLAQKEAYVARFYEKRDAKLAAFRRWEGLKRSFADLAEFKEQPQAAALLAEANQKAESLGSQLEQEGDKQ